MTIEALRPFPLGLTNPFTPVGYTTAGTPIFPAQGGRSGGGVSFDVRDDDGSPDFDDDDEADDDDDEADGDTDEDDQQAQRRPVRRNAQRATPEADDDGGETDWAPPNREAWDRVQGALKRANAEAGKRRRIGKEMERLGIGPDGLAAWLTERGIDPTTGLPFGDDVVDPRDSTDDHGFDEYEREDDTRRRRDDTERDQRARDRDTARKMLAAERRGQAAERERLMGVLAEQSARLALRDAGFVGTASQLDRMLRTIDPGSLELEMDGDAFELVGIDEAVEELKTDFAEYFEDDRPTRRRTATRTTANGRPSRTRSARDVDGGDRGRQPKKPMGWAEQMVAQMERRGRA